MSELSSVRRRAEQALLQSPVGPPLRHAYHRRRGAQLDWTLRRPIISGIVADALYRGVTGRPALRHERADLRRRARTGEPIEEIVHRIVASPSGVDQTLSRSVAAAQTKVRADFPTGETMQQRLVFLHIMKVGGTSLSDLCTRLVGEDLSRVHLTLDDLALAAPPVLARLRCIAGHIPYEALELVPGAFSTLCVLRDPMSRTISHYVHLKKSGRPELTLDQFVFDDTFHVASRNYQARQLGLSIGAPDAWRTYSPDAQYRKMGGEPPEILPLQSLFDSVVMPLSDDQLLERAAANLETIEYVGVTERMDALVGQLARFFGGSEMQLARLNVSPSIDPREVDARIRRQIEARNAVDRHLYELASRRSH